jgi:hypothetical protein
MHTSPHAQRIADSIGVAEGVEGFLDSIGAPFSNSPKKQSEYEIARAQLAAQQNQSANPGAEAAGAAAGSMMNDPRTQQARMALGGGGPTVIKAGWDQSRSPFRKETTDAFFKARGDEKAAVERLGQDQAADHVLRAQALEQYGKDAADVEAGWKAKQLEQQTQRAQASEKLTNAMQNASAAGKIDPGHYWADKSMASKIGWLISATAGGMLQGTGAGANQALAQMNTLVEQDIAAQKDRAANAREDVGAQKTLYANMLQQFGDERDAYLATKISLNEKLKNDLMTQAEKAGSVEAQDMAAKAAAGIDQDTARMQMEFLDRAQYRPAQVIGGGAAASSKPDPLFVPTGPNGQGYRVATNEERDKHVEARTAAANLEALANKAKAIRAKTNFAERAGGNTGISLLESADHASLKSIATQMGTEINRLNKSGSWDDGAAKAAMEQVGNLTSTFGNPTAATDTLVEMTKVRLDNMQRGSGGQAAQKQLAVTPQGDIATRTIGQPGFASPRPNMPTFKPGAK